MRYVGSKARIAKQIRDLALDLRTDDQNHYVEPFLGGANSFSVIAPHFTRATALELNQDVAMMWQAVKDGWTPPTNVSEDEYEALRHAPASPRRGFVGTGGSFGGKWFAGYARGGFMADGSPRNHQAESARAILKQAGALSNATIRAESYENAPVDRGCVVYCDPPYGSTLNYRAVENFDHERFWKVAAGWAELGALVLVSEYGAPDGWNCAREFDHRQSVSLARDRRKVVEKVFVHKSYGAVADVIELRWPTLGTALRDAA